MEVVQSASESKQAAPRFETIRIGDTIPACSYGELTIIDAVRWAGFQENYAQLHYDREYVRREGNLKTFIASGAYRESLMVRLLTDWMGPKGRLCKLATRQMNPTFEGDSMTFSGEVVEKSADAAEPWVVLEMKGVNQDGQQILAARCTVLLESGRDMQE